MDAPAAGFQTADPARGRQALPSRRAVSNAPASAPCASSRPQCEGCGLLRREPPPATRPSRGRTACAAARRPATPGTASCTRGTEPTQCSAATAALPARRCHRRSAAPPVARHASATRPAKPHAASRAPRSRRQALLQRRLVGIVGCCNRDRQGCARAKSVAVGRRSIRLPTTSSDEDAAAYVAAANRVSLSPEHELLRLGSSELLRT